jgi:hypothetical protein
MDPTENDASPGADAPDTTSEAMPNTDDRRSRQQRTVIGDLVDPFLRAKTGRSDEEWTQLAADTARKLTLSRCQQL